MKYTFCTHFDINYIAHARSLYDSLENNGLPFTLFMFCMCDESYSFLKEINYSNAKLVHFSELEKFIPELLFAKTNRSKVEYFYTCSPATCYYVLSNFNKINLVTYLDADLYFFSSPEPIFKEIGNSSIGIIEHKFGWLTKRNIIYGRFNVGWISFKRDYDGMKCLKDWMDDCIDWCYQKLEGNRYADQKYLDQWPVKYNNICIIEHKGANLAVWNISNYRIRKENNDIYIDDDLLIFYHFANLKQIDHFLFKTDLSRVFKRTAGIIKTDIYIPYIIRLLSNKNASRKIHSKKDAHISGFYSLVVNATRIIRDKFFPDLIEFK
ncbi:hypothetical protein [Pedobacter panaciterrae]|uniref:hypothetical protein n=1 Tax=Pedobacter panaciterrae TaxID=363849 RepID=UPI00259A522F|nr:hypothetical protein [uncultured Pedobacter sp.]